FTNQLGIGFIHCWTNSENLPDLQKPGTHKVSLNIPSIRLYQGNYCLNFYLSGPPGELVYERIKEVCNFQVFIQNIKREFQFESGVAAYFEDQNWTID
ncbi:MAG: hypothetical protein ACK452_10080, partial [Bacteroidota bacterium]